VPIIAVWQRKLRGARMGKVVKEGGWLSHTCKVDMLFELRLRPLMDRQGASSLMSLMLLWERLRVSSWKRVFRFAARVSLLWLMSRRRMGR
jgi:hypothetical protein